MGDAGEGLIDAEARIQERMEDLERERARTPKRGGGNPEQVRTLESLRLARRELERQLNVSAHERRRVQILQAMEEIDRRMAEVRAATP